MTSPNDLLKKFKDRVKTKGAKGFLDLQKIFKMMDYDGSQSISISEFKKSLKSFNMEFLQDQEVTMLFNVFDRNRDGTINY